MSNKKKMTTQVKMLIFNLLDELFETWTEYEMASPVDSRQEKRKNTVLRPATEGHVRNSILRSRYL